MCIRDGVNYHAAGFEPGWTASPLDATRRSSTSATAAVYAASLNGTLPPLVNVTRQPRRRPEVAVESYAHYLSRLPLADALRVEQFRMLHVPKQGPAFPEIVDACAKTPKGRATLVCLEDHYAPTLPTFDATWLRILSLIHI